MVVPGEFLEYSVRGGVGFAQPRSPDFPAEVNDLAEDEGVFPKGSKHQQDAGQQPDLQGSHLAGNWDARPEMKKEGQLQPFKMNLLGGHITDVKI